jgi:chemotaxis methyl-accepting protein methylase
MKEIHRTLAEGSWLLLGGAESAFGMEEWFERLTVGNLTIYVAR